MNEYVQYSHHGKVVWVRKDLKGTHRDACMCYDCGNFHSGLPEGNCPIANLMFAVALAEGTVAPVYECPKFEQSERYKFQTVSGQP